MLRLHSEAAVPTLDVKHQEKYPSPQSGFEIFQQIFGVSPGEWLDWDFQLMTLEEWPTVVRGVMDEFPLVWMFCSTLLQ